MTPFKTSTILWGLWAVSWGVAALWSRRTAARPAFLDQMVHYLPTVIGAGLLFGWGVRLRARGYLTLWSEPEWAGWILTGLLAAGFGFTWWARVSLGSLWSSTVVRKEGHAVVETGPYAIVRHPIYTGLIVAALAYAAEIGAPMGLIGAALMALGFWLKARLEERFLREQLGPDAYDGYRRRTPMLVPFWPRPG